MTPHTSKSRKVNCTEVSTPSDVSTFVFGMRGGKFLGAAAASPPPKTSMGSPPQNCPRFMKMKDTPIAATSGASLGALRSGR